MVTTTTTTQIETDATDRRAADYTTTARYLGVKVGTVRVWVARAQIPHYRLGQRLVRFDLDEIDAWLSTRAVTVKP